MRTVLRTVRNCTLGMLLGTISCSIAENSLILASTTSTENSGMYDYLLPHFTRHSGIQVKVVAVGTGKAIAIAKRGDAGALIVHDLYSEQEFMREGYGVLRTSFMYDHYLIVGPRRGGVLLSAPTLAGQLAEIARRQLLFVSRGDDSGTHKMELSLWREVHIVPRGDWYISAGGGMGRILNISNELMAYTLTNSAIWMSFNNRLNLQEISKKNDSSSRNTYSIIVVSPKFTSAQQYNYARQFYAWLLSPQTLERIDRFRINGEQAFFVLPIPLRHNS